MKKTTIALIMLSLLLSILFTLYSYNIQSQPLHSSSTFKIHVYTNDDEEASSEGSGVAVGPNLILTNYHLVQYPKKIIIVNKGNKYEAKLKAYDLKSDLAILETLATFKAIKLSLNEAKKDKKVELVHKGRFEEGFIEDVKQSIPNDLSSLFKYIKIIDVYTEHGSSGGAVLNGERELIGIISARVIEDDLYILMPNQ
jgi:S1-C subfamily serine protease